ncbi:hypothetical protein [Hephaestia mangrovi]|uniref:hypothetical protein n=1 Tax=Hephaestia mangrovi TaxID=2873268 RepID=UPI001CA699B4|nr:hypothetical protein [Hephaestia mangrovi]MBY8827945.1 hypothetical protein [Hephaestia mangrovi]
MTIRLLQGLAILSLVLMVVAVFVRGGFPAVGLLPFLLAALVFHVLARILILLEEIRDRRSGAADDLR